jgi:hypothetical protein
VRKFRLRPEEQGPEVKYKFLKQHQNITFFNLIQEARLEEELTAFATMADSLLEDVAPRARVEMMTRADSCALASSAFTVISTVVDFAAHEHL